MQQFDAAFGGENFTESSKLRSMAMHLQKSARQWWASLRVQGEAPKTWAKCREAILKQFLYEEARNEVLTTWRSLKLNKNEPVQKYVDRFWDANLKAMVYQNIDFSEQKQQYCAGLPQEIRDYVQAQRPKTIAAMIHHTRVAVNIAWKNLGDQGHPPPREPKSNVNKSTPKFQSSRKAKGGPSPYKGQNKLSPEEMDKYKKEGKCFKCGKTGHLYRACPLRNAKKTPPQVSSTFSLNETPEANKLCHVWGKIRDQNVFILMDPGSTHNLISQELAAKLGIKTEEMESPEDADGAFKGQRASVTPLIGKLRIHIQNYVDYEDFYVSPLAHQDVILGTPWFFRKSASLSYPSRKVVFTHKDRAMDIQTNVKGQTYKTYNRD